MLKEIWSNRRVIYRLSIIDFKSFFKSSILSYFWIFISPLLMIGMYLFSFYAAQGKEGIDNISLPSYNSNDFIFLETANAENYPKIGWLIIGVLTWTYIGNILTSGSHSIRTYSWLVTKIGSPLSTPPMLVNLSKFYIGLGSIIVSWIIYMIIASTNNQKVCDIEIIQLPLLIILLFCFLCLWSIFIAPLTAISRDIFNLILIIPLLLQWVTGVFLPLSPANMDSAIGIIFRINPFNFLISNIRLSIMGNGWFWNDAISLISFASFFAIFFILAWFINKRSKKVVVDLI